MKEKNRKIDRNSIMNYAIGNKPATPLPSMRISGRYFFALRFLYEI